MRPLNFGTMTSHKRLTNANDAETTLFQKVDINFTYLPNETKTSRHFSLSAGIRSRLSWISSTAPYVRYLEKKVKETGILIDKPKHKKPKTVRTPENIVAVAEIEHSGDIIEINFA